MRRVGPIRAVLDDLCELTTVPRRGDIDVIWLADRMQRARDAMDPVAAVQALRDAGEPDQALSLARAVLVDAPHYDVLVLAATIAYQDTAAPLEALTLLDRAVEADPERVDAYAEQMSVIAIGDLWKMVLSLLSDAIDDSFTRRLDTIVQTAFHRLPHALRGKHAPAMASHLILQGRAREANTFVHKWLYDGKTLTWWRFDLVLAYATTFWMLGRRTEAVQVGEVMRQGLKRVRENGSMETAMIDLYELLLMQLEDEMRRTDGFEEEKP
jgi:tetratricopeptide (TPR) repeat protein